MNQRRSGIQAAATATGPETAGGRRLGTTTCGGEAHSNGGSSRLSGKQKPPDRSIRGLDEALSNDLLSRGLSHTTIGAGAFHFRVRDGAKTRAYAMR